LRISVQSFAIIFNLFDKRLQLLDYLATLTVSVIPLKVTRSIVEIFEASLVEESLFIRFEAF
jgi:hypothetical protein